MKLRKIEGKMHWSSLPWLQYVTLAFLVAALGIFVRWGGGFADPDAFYHAAMPSVLVEYGTNASFPWLPFTSLAQGYTDHHFLYHIFLLPFSYFFGELTGIVVATIVLTVFLALVLLWFLRSMRVKGAFWYVAFLFLQSPFLFRVELAKVPVVSLLVLFIGLWCLFHRRHYGLLIVSFIYTWTYGGWPILPALVIGHIVVRFVHELLTHKRWRIKKYWRRTWKHDGWSLSATFIGCGLGVVLNPYFPSNLGFFWQQVFQIAVLDAHGGIGVGGEWHPYALQSFVGDAGLLLLALFLTTIAFVVTPRKHDSYSWFFIVTAYGFMVLTLSSQRYIEYFAPFTVVAMALVVQRWLQLRSHKLQHMLRYVGVVVFVGLLPIFFLSVTSVRQSFAYGFEPTRLAEESRWLSDNSMERDVVFHTDWDHFPMLFFNNKKNSYIAGLDPRFFYFEDQDLFRRYVDVVEGRAADELYKTITILFDAKYVLVEVDRHVDFDRQLTNNIYFELAFEGDKYKIYRVTSQE